MFLLKNCTDVWTYYFEPTSNLAYEPNDIIHNNNFPRGKENFTTIYEKYADAIENPSFPTKELRIWTKKNLIDRFVKPKKSLIKKIESFYQENMAGCHIIGVHLRGKHIWNEVKYPQLQEIFDEANRHASPQSKFFVATDQKILLNEAKKNLKGPVIYYDCYRMDEDSTSNVLWGKHLPINYSKARLGEDVLIEVSLLSRCDVMIHTISCVSLAASYFNPELHGVRLYYEKNLLKKFSF